MDLRRIERYDGMDFCVCRMIDLRPGDIFTISEDNKIVGTYIATSELFFTENGICAIDTTDFNGGGV